MMSSSSDEYERILEEAFAKLRNHAPKEYAWLNASPEKRENVNESAKAVAREQFGLSKKLSGQSLGGIDNQLSKSLSSSRMTMLRHGFDLETFHMNLNKRSDGVLWLEMSREGKKLEPPKAILESQSIEWAIFQLYASILVEAFDLVTSLVGVRASFKGYIDKVLNNTARSIKSSSKLQRALAEFAKAWNEAGGNAFKKATALYNLIKDSSAFDVFWTILEDMSSNMDRYDWLKTAIQVTVIIIAAVATDGVALIAEIALIVSGAKDFAQKIQNLNELEKKRSELD